MGAVITPRIAASGSSSATSPRTVSITLPSGTGRKMVVCSVLEDASLTTTGVTYNGTSLTSFGSTAGTTMKMSWWYLDVADALGTGAYDLVFTLSAGTSTRHSDVVWFTSGDAMGAPQVTFATAASDTTLGVTVNHGASDLLLSVGANANSAATVSSSPLANASNISLPGFRLGKADQVPGTSGSTTTTWTFSTASELVVGTVNTTPSGGGGGNAPRSMFYHLQGMR